MRGRVLIVDDDRSTCELLHEFLTQRGFAISTRSNGDEGFELLGREQFDAVLTDLNLPGMSGVALCERIRANWPDLPAIVITAFGSLDTAVAAIRAGAYDFITKPFQMESLLLTMDRAIQYRNLQEEVKRLRTAVEKSRAFTGLVGESSPMRKLADEIARVGDSESSVLVTGETGTGKELVARAIHARSRRREGPFIPVSCAAMPEPLLESELFGHLKGAFTDAKTARKGLFLAFQYPTEISGVGYSHFLRNAYNTLNKALPEDQSREVFLTVREFYEYVKKNLAAVGLDQSFLSRYLNEGFSGGEKKRSEVMQMLVLKPYLAILDEPDSGLDIDAVKAVAEAINQLIDSGAGVLVITHYARILRYLKKLDQVHVVAKGKVIKSGSKELSEELETKGYGWLGLEDEK